MLLYSSGKASSTRAVYRTLSSAGETIITLFAARFISPACNSLAVLTASPFWIRLRAMISSALPADSNVEATAIVFG